MSKKGVAPHTDSNDTEGLMTINTNNSIAQETENVKTPEELKREYAEKMLAEKKLKAAKLPFIWIDDNDKFHVNSQLLAEYVREHAHYKFVQDKNTGAVTRYWYMNGFYNKVSDSVIMGLIKEYVRAFDILLATPSVISNAYADLKTDLVFVKAEDMNADENIINFQNGLLYLDAMELKPHTPKVLTTNQIPCNYNPKQTSTPVFDRYIKELTALHADPKQTQAFLLEYMGVIISNVQGHKYKKALFMQGKSNSGKSQLKKLVEMLIGSDNFSPLSLGELEKRFGASNLFNKRLGGCDDMEYITMKELAIFKTVTGGGNLFTEYKGKDGFNFIYNGLLWFCMNELPKFGGDRGEAVYNRVVVLKCDNVIPYEKQDKQLINKMYAEREGIITRIVKALKKTIENGYNFDIPTECKDFTKDYKESNSSVIQFVNNYLDVKNEPPKDGITRTDIYKMYVEYCKMNNNGFAETDRKFYAELEAEYGEKAAVIQVRNVGRCFKGISITAAAFIDLYKNKYGVFNAYWADETRNAGQKPDKSDYEQPEAEPTDREKDIINGVI